MKEVIMLRKWHIFNQGGSIVGSIEETENNFKLNIHINQIEKQDMNFILGELAEFKNQYCLDNKDRSIK